MERLVIFMKQWRDMVLLNINNRKIRNGQVPYFEKVSA